MTLFIKSSPSVLETAAALLRTYVDRAPSCDRQGLHEIADSFEEEAVALGASTGDCEEEDGRDVTLDLQGYSF